MGGDKMSLNDQKSFLSNIHPFEFLDEEQMDLCINHMDIAYYPKDTVLINEENIPMHFFIIIKGSVAEFNNDDEMVMDYSTEDSFDANSLIYGKCKNRFVAKEDLICYEIEKKIFLKLIEINEEFKNFFLNDMVHRLKVLK